METLCNREFGYHTCDSHTISLTHIQTHRNVICQYLSVPVSCTRNTLCLTHIHTTSLTRVYTHRQASCEHLCVHVPFTQTHTISLIYTSTPPHTCLYIHIHIRVYVYTHRKASGERPSDHVPCTQTHTLTHTRIHTHTQICKLTERLLANTCPTTSLVLNTLQIRGSACTEKKRSKKN